MREKFLFVGAVLDDFSGLVDLLRYHLLAARAQQPSVWPLLAWGGIWKGPLPVPGGLPSPFRLAFSELAGLAAQKQPAHPAPIEKVLNQQPMNGYPAQGGHMMFYGRVGLPVYLPACRPMGRAAG